MITIEIQPVLPVRGHFFARNGDSKMKILFVKEGRQYKLNPPVESSRTSSFRVSNKTDWNRTKASQVTGVNVRKQEEKKLTIATARNSKVHNKAYRRSLKL